ncbi:Serine/threonine-protein kinase wnk4, partial [Mortierella sp. AD094]
VTKEYPYSECTNQAQIYRKVTQGIKPQAIEQVQDSEIKEFINCCLDHNPCTRPSAQELLDSDFLKLCLAESEGPIPYRSDTPVAIVQPPTHVAIPAAEFTLTTVDADNKTYHIRSNLLPLTPTSPLQDPLATNQPESGSQTPNVAGNQKSAPGPAHSHTNSELCSIQVVQYGEAVGSHLNLKMICTCPVAGVDGPTGTHEIKFPFDLEVDTVEDVVSEMIREKILSADDKGEAMSRMNVLVASILQEKGQAKKAEEQEVPMKNEVSLLEHTRPILPSALPSSFLEATIDLVPLSHAAPLPVQRAEALPAHHPIQHPVQQPAQLPVQLPAQTPAQTPAQPPVQPPAQRTATAIRPWSPPLAPRINHALQTPPRPKSVHDLNHVVARESRPTASSMSGISVPMMQQLSNAGSTRPRERQRSISTTAFENEDDIGYTSPYRHGVSGSSVKSHRRTPSCDTSTVISKALSVPASLRIFNPPPDSTGSGRHRAQSDLGQFMASAPSFSSLLTQPTPTSETPSIASVVLSLGISSTSANTSNNNIVSAFESSKNEPEPRGEDTDSGISSGVSSPASVGLNSIRSQEQLEPHSDAPIEMPQLVPAVQQDLLSPQSAIRAPSHAQIDDSIHPMSSSISSDGSFGGMMMTIEAKRDIELWSDNVQRTRDQVVPTAEYPNQRHPEHPHHHRQERNGSSSSLGYPDMSDEKDEIEDEDLRILLEQQRRELERMRLQHELEWREMMRLKELKDKNGAETRIRRVSEANPITRLV